MSADMQKQEQRTHLPPAEAGAPTLVSCSKTEAAGAAVRVGGLEVEAAILAGVTPAAGDIFLQIRQRLRASRAKNEGGFRSTEG